MAFELPAGFRFGVAMSGFQTEGGYNGPGQPANNWLEWERSGRVEPAGVAIELWDRYEEHLDRAVAAGCDSVRLSVEWARCQPSPHDVDHRALAHYRRILEGCAERGIEPVVCLHHFTHPHWLGPDLWLGLDSPRLFEGWATLAVEELGARCRRWITINEPNGLAVQAYVLGSQPPGRRLAHGDLVRALDHLLAAHVLGSAAIRRHQPAAVVTTNNSASTVYELDRLLVDVLLAPASGVTRQDLASWLAERRASYHAAVPAGGHRDRGLRRVLASIVPLERALPRAVDAAYRHARSLDVVAVDYYDPVAGHHLRAPRHRWDDRVHPEGMPAVLAASADGVAGLEVEVAENGLCNRVRRGVALPRGDGWDRLRYLRANLAAVVRAIEAGVPVTGYFHWTLADCYEWGSYQPRFGLYGVDRTGARPRVLDHDSFGGDAAGAYRRLIDGLRDGDTSVLVASG